MVLFSQPTTSLSPCSIIRSRGRLSAGYRSAPGGRPAPRPTPGRGDVRAGDGPGSWDRRICQCRDSLPRPHRLGVGVAA